MRHLITIFLILKSFFLFAQDLSEDIRINQIGFLTTAKKAVVIVNSSSIEFQIRINETTTVVFTGSLGSEQIWDSSGENV